MMIRRFRLKSESSRNVLVLASGTAIAQALPLAASPVLTRIYSPSDFGMWALFVSVTAVLGSIASGRYELAIMLPKEDHEAFQVAALGLIVASCVTIATLVSVLIFGGPIAKALGDSRLESWLLLAPIVVWLTALFNSLNYMNNRLNNYAEISRAYVAKSLVLVTVQLLVGMFTSGPQGLISGQVASSAAANVRMAKRTLAVAPSRDQLTWISMKRAARRYRRFPLLSMPANLANVLSTQLTNVLISAVFSVSTLGLYSFVQRILGVPSSLIGTSIGQVYFRSAAASAKAVGNSLRVYDRTVFRAALVSIPMFTVLAIVSPTLFEIVFGSEWRIAGDYTRILAPLFAVRFIVTSVSTTTIVFERQGTALVWQLLLLVLSIGTVAFAWLDGFSVETFLYLYAVLISLHYVFLWALMRRIARKGNNK